MKVFFFDSVPFKTTKHWYKYLCENHEVVHDTYFNPVYAEWADVIYMEWCEGAAIEASQGRNHYDNVYDHAGVRGTPNATYSGDFDWSSKPLFIRGIDIDILQGHFRQVRWENVTGFLTIAKHIERITNDGSVAYPEKLKRACIPLSVDLGEWNYRERDGSGRKIAWINHNWSAKGLPLMLQAFYELSEQYYLEPWELHIVENGRSTEYWLHRYVQHMLDKFKIRNKVFFYPTVDSVDRFLEDKDYLVSSSHKEAFSLILAEAMAKGIQALTHSWEGADEIWPEEMVWTTAEDFKQKIAIKDFVTHPKYDSPHYRDLANQYNALREIAALKDVTGL